MSLARDGEGTHTSRGRVRRRPSPGIREVAKRAGVGTASVSRVLSGHADVSEAMRQRVLHAVAELDYQPDLVARGLRQQATHSVGFVLSDISNPLLSEIVRGAEGVLSEAGFSMLLTNSEDSPELDARQVRQLHQRRVDGLILLTAAENNPSTMELLTSLDIPLVIIDRDLGPQLRASYVLSDHQAGMRDAARHLLELGHRQIGVIMGRNVRPSRERLRAVAETLAEADCPPPIVEAGQLSTAFCHEALQRLLDRTDPPSAVILGGNLLLVGALEVVRDRGLILGRDLSLIGCDDVPLARLTEPAVSIVTRDAERIGHTAADLLLARIHGEESKSPESVLLPTWYKIRDSCGSAPGS